MMSIGTTSRVVNFLHKLLGRDLTYDERVGLTQFIRDSFVNEADETVANVTIVSNLAEKYYNLINKQAEYHVINILGCTKIPRKHRAYLTLDSRYATFNQACTKLTWSISETILDTDNLANLLGGVRNITGIRLQNFVITDVSSVQLRATVLIEELSAQSFILPGGRKFHFLSSVDELYHSIEYSLTGNQWSGMIVPDFTIFNKYELNLTHKFNDGYYRFNIPITMLNNITISIGSPETLVVIPKYEYKNVPVIAMTTNSITLDIGEVHNFQSHNPMDAYAVVFWYSIFIDGLNTDELANANYENYVNTHEHTASSFPSPSQVTVYFIDFPAGYYSMSPPPSFNTQSLTTVPLSQVSTVRVRFNSYRVIINMELEYEE